MIFARLLRLAVVALFVLIVHLGTCAREADGVLTLKLRAAVGLWRPEGPDGPELTIEAFGEDAGVLQIPAPLLRVIAGTEIAASIRNDLDVNLRVHGLCARDGSPCAPVTVPPSGQREVRFTVTTAGTFHYWATTTDMPLQFRAAMDTQLSGAFIVDRAGARAGDDRCWSSRTGRASRAIS